MLTLFDVTTYYTPLWRITWKPSNFLCCSCQYCKVFCNPPPSPQPQIFGLFQQNRPIIRADLYLYASSTWSVHTRPLPSLAFYARVLVLSPSLWHNAGSFGCCHWGVTFFFKNGVWSTTKLFWVNKCRKTATFIENFANFTTNSNSSRTRRQPDKTLHHARCNIVTQLFGNFCQIKCWQTLSAVIFLPPDWCRHIFAIIWTSHYSGEEINFITTLII